MMGDYIKFLFILLYYLSMYSFRPKTSKTAGILKWIKTNKV